VHLSESLGTNYDIAEAVGGDTLQASLHADGQASLRLGWQPHLRSQWLKKSQRTIYQGMRVLQKNA